MPDVPRFPFEVVPVEAGTFEPFVLDVPTLSGRGFAARRAWWSAFHVLGPRGLEPEQFEVYVFDGDVRGDRVGAGGLVPAAVSS
jgi:hypothetical protein